MMEWMSDTTVWVGLLTLVLLEIVLGIDNLIFIAIVADKLPPEQRNRARLVGLSLALVMRLALLASISWVMSLTAPLFTVFDLEISWRGIILIVGGGFLLVKATIEIHDRLEAQPHGPGAGGQAHASFWMAVAQILVLDIVFSLDSVITAVGMVDELYVMMAAVVVAVIVMLFASKPLSEFVNAHPSLIILCLGFLLMVGFVLMADGFGVHVPKGYLYAAIVFSVLIETFNQLALRNRRKLAASIPPRQRVADAVLRLIGGVPVAAHAAPGGDASALDAADPKEEVFAPVEKRMVQSVLGLADRSVRTIMTPRTDVEWIDAQASRQDILSTIRKSLHRQFVVGRGSIDDIAGLARKEDLLELYLSDQPFDLSAALQQPVAMHEGTSILDALDAVQGQAGRDGARDRRIRRPARHRHAGQLSRGDRGRSARNGERAAEAQAARRWLDRDRRRNVDLRRAGAAGHRRAARRRLQYAGRIRALAVRPHSVGRRAHRLARLELRGPRDGRLAHRQGAGATRRGGRRGERIEVMPWNL